MSKEQITMEEIELLAEQVETRSGDYLVALDALTSLAMHAASDFGKN